MTQVLQRGEPPHRYRLRVADEVPEAFIPLRVKLVEIAPQGAGGDLWALVEWRPTAVVRIDDERLSALLTAYQIGAFDPHERWGDEEALALDLLEARAQVRELRQALEKSCEIIRTWHGMGTGRAERAWKIYRNQAPEMEPIRRLLGIQP